MKPFFWIDLEMTGLDETVHKIIEVAVIITDTELKPVDSYHEVVFQPQEVLDQMDDWCKKTHGKTGLTKAVPNGKPIKEVEKDLIHIASRHFAADERIVICGNSVANDQKFIQKYLPDFDRLLHYRLIDVSSFKEVYRTKYGLEFKKKNTHRALDDIQESIKELEYYLSFVKHEPTT